MPPGEPAAPGAGSTRARPTALLLVAALLAVARIATGIHEERHRPDMPDLVRWQPMEGAEAAAHATGRPVLYDFTAEWCAPCRIMQREVFGDPEAAREIQDSFLPVRVLDRLREEGRNTALVDSLQRRFRVNSFPTLVAVPPRGDPVVMVGYQGRAATMRRLRAARAQGAPPPTGGPPGGRR